VSQVPGPCATVAAAAPAPAASPRIDPLTGLPDRQGFLQTLGDALHDATLDAPSDAVLGAAPPLFGVLLIDLDHFKFVNDTVGHGAGDSLLVVAADRIRQRTPHSGLVARMGGDEFAVWMPVDRASTAIALAEELRIALDQPIAVGGVDNYTSASVGVVVAPATTSAQRLLAEADTAMTTAKGAGGNSYAVFDDALRARMAERSQSLRDLNRAINAREIDLDVQPIFDLRDGSRAYEMLARWNHPTRGRLSPAAFIGLAEQSGLIGRLGHQILELGASHAAELDARVSVNVSVRQFNRTLTQQVGDLIERYRLAPGQLVIEITESAVIDNEHAQAILAGLRSVGAHIWIDDFGTGYSSLSRLTNLRVDGLKLPREFIDDLDSPQGWGIAAAIVGIARALDIDVIAEGVETRHQLAQLRRLGCDAVQGYLLGRPRPFRQELDALAAGSQREGASWIEAADAEPVAAPATDPAPATPPPVAESPADPDPAVQHALHLLWEHLPLGLLVVDTEGTIRIANPRAAVMAGRSQPEVLGRSLFEFLAPEDATFIVAVMARGLDFSGRVLGPFRLRYRHRDGTLHSSEHWAFETPPGLGFDGYVVTMAHESTGDVLGAAYRDIAAGAELDVILARIADAMAAHPVEAIGAVLVVEDGELVRCVGACPLGGSGHLGCVPGPWRDVANGGADVAVPVADLPEPIASTVLAAGYRSLWLRGIDHAGVRRGVLAVWHPQSAPPSPNHERSIDEATSAAALAFGQDDHRTALRRATLLDPLTGVGNLRKLEHDATTTPSAFAIAVDLDGFHAVQERFGRAVGEMLLRTVADRLIDVVGDRGRVYRVDGDQFAVLVDADPQWGDDHHVAAQVAGEIQSALRVPYAVTDLVDVSIHASFGTAIAGPGERGDHLLSRATESLLWAPATGPALHVVVS
jgi:diguanylate cyclase (GGDEF)-like protein/PAS domain S-box-containing protein